MADVFDIDISGEDVQNDARWDEDDNQDSFHKCGCASSCPVEVCYSNDFFLLAHQMTMMNPMQSM